MDLPDAEPSPEEPEIESPIRKHRLLYPKSPKSRAAEEDQQEKPAEVKPLGSGVTDSDTGADLGDDDGGQDAQSASPVFIEGLERDLLARFYLQTQPVSTRISKYASSLVPMEL